MDNETTMPGLLTLPGTLDSERSQPKAGRALLYKLIFAAALLTLGLVFWLH